jgi:hypothetical protein
VDGLLTVSALVGLIMLITLAATDLWIAAMSTDELSQMGLEK